MRITVSLSILAIVSTLAACRGEQATDLKELAITSDFPTASCGSGNPEYFRFDPLPALPALDGLSIPAADAGPLQATAPSAAKNLRLAVCFDQNADNPTLAQVADPGLFGPSGAMNLPASSIVQGLEPALFGGSYQDLRIEIPLETIKKPNGTTAPTKIRLIIKGYELNGQKFVAAYYLDSPAGSESATFTVSNVLLGTLAFGNLSTAACAEGEPVDKSFKLGTAAFIVSACPMLGSSGTHNAKVVRISVTDSATNLPDAVRSVAQVVSGEALTQVYTSRTAHHNVCDSFALKLPHAIYAATADAKGFGGGSCASPVTFAPPRPADDQGGVEYRIRYGDDESAWISGNTGSTCRHYLWRCE